MHFPHRIGNEAREGHRFHSFNKLEPLIQLPWWSSPLCAGGIYAQTAGVHLWGDRCGCARASPPHTSRCSKSLTEWQFRFAIFGFHLVVFGAEIRSCTAGKCCSCLLFLQTSVPYLWSGTGDAEDGRSTPAEGENHWVRVRSWSYPPPSAAKKGAESAQRHGWMRRAGAVGLSSTAGSARIGPRAVTSQRRSSASRLARERVSRCTCSARTTRESGYFQNKSLLFCGFIIYLISNDCVCIIVETSLYF